MPRSNLSWSFALLVTACSPYAADTVVEDAISNWCPPVPAGYPDIEIHRTAPHMRPGERVTFSGLNFDKLPGSTVAWFRTDNNGHTATSQLHVESPTRAWALVPSHHLVAGPGQVSFYYTECFDCSAQGGNSNSCQGNWVNPNAAFLPVQFDGPAPLPLPVSNATATAVSDTTIQLTWQDNSTDEEYFEIRMGPNPHQTNTVLGNVRKDQITEPIYGLQADQLYCFEVRAVNRFGSRPVAIESKPCVQTLPVQGDFGDIQISNVPGFDNTLCAGLNPHIRLRVFVDSNRDGVINAIEGPALNEPGPATMVPNVNNTPAWNIFVANRYAPGANMVLLGHMFSCGGYDPQFVALHMFWDGGETVTPLLYMAGNYRERTGPQNEYFGSVMTRDELNAPIFFDAENHTIHGEIRHVIGFHVEIPNNGASFDSFADVSIDFNAGVEVEHE